MIRPNRQARRQRGKSDTADAVVAALAGAAYGHHPLREQQQPADADKPLLDLVHEHFKARPHDFEQFAADIWRMSQPNVDRVDVTRPWRDGGRDAGYYSRRTEPVIARLIRDRAMRRELVECDDRSFADALVAVFDRPGKENCRLGAWDGVDDHSILRFIQEHRTPES